MPQNTHVEMADIEAARIAQEKKEPAADFAALRKNAEEVSRCLAWNPSVHASRFFSARWKAMAATLRPVLEKVGRAKRCGGGEIQPIWIGARSLAPSQVTTTLPAPDGVDGPMLQVHETPPLLSAVLAVNP